MVPIPFSPQSLLMFSIRYFAPYSYQWYTQSFATLQEANRMITFYLSNGSSAYLISK